MNLEVKWIVRMRDGNDDRRDRWRKQKLRRNWEMCLGFVSKLSEQRRKSRAHEIDVCRTTRDQLIILSGLYVHIVYADFCWETRTAVWTNELKQQQKPKEIKPNLDLVYKQLCTSSFFIQVTQNEILTADNCIQQLASHSIHHFNRLAKTTKLKHRKKNKSLQKKEKKALRQQRGQKKLSISLLSLFIHFGALSYRFN